MPRNSRGVKPRFDPFSWGAPMKANSRARAASVNSARTPNPPIRREVGRSNTDGNPRHVKIVHTGGVAAGDLGLFVVRHPGQDLRQDLARLGKGRLAVRIVRAPHHVVDADYVAQGNADGVLLEAEEDVAGE